jgi:hypothetical protein
MLNKNLKNVVVFIVVAHCFCSETHYNYKLVEIQQ